MFILSNWKKWTLVTFIGILIYNSTNRGELMTAQMEYFICMCVYIYVTVYVVQKNIIYIYICMLYNIHILYIHLEPLPKTSPNSTSTIPLLPDLAAESPPVLLRWFGISRRVLGNSPTKKKNKNRIWGMICWDDFALFWGLFLYSTFGGWDDLIYFWMITTQSNSQVRPW